MAVEICMRVKNEYTGFHNDINKIKISHLLRIHSFPDFMLKT